ncbi:MAG: type II toxin-antitoxin system Phd/YefM family antitoxin [Methanocella sp.]
MPIIRPSSDLRNKFNEISELVHEKGEPIFITRNGRDDMVVMSMAAFEQREAKFDLMRKLLEAEAEVRAGEPLVAHEDVWAKLRERYHV